MNKFKILLLVIVMFSVLAVNFSLAISTPPESGSIENASDATPPDNGDSASVGGIVTPPENGSSGNASATTIPQGGNDANTNGNTDEENNGGNGGGSSSGSRVNRTTTPPSNPPVTPNNNLVMIVPTNGPLPTLVARGNSSVATTNPNAVGQTQTDLTINALDDESDAVGQTQTAAASDASGNFFANKYFRWFFVLVLIIVGAFLVKEHKKRNP